MFIYKRKRGLQHNYEGLHNLVCCPELRSYAAPAFLHEHEQAAELPGGPLLPPGPSGLSFWIPCQALNALTFNGCCTQIVIVGGSADPPLVSLTSLSYHTGHRVVAHP